MVSVIQHYNSNTSLAEHGKDEGNNTVPPRFLKVCTKFLCVFRLFLSTSILLYFVTCVSSHFCFKLMLFVEREENKIIVDHCNIHSENTMMTGQS